jgi:hypothetical protein
VVLDSFRVIVIDMTGGDTSGHGPGHDQSLEGSDGSCPSLSGSIRMGGVDIVCPASDRGRGTGTGSESTSSGESVHSCDCDVESVALTLSVWIVLVCCVSIMDSRKGFCKTSEERDPKVRTGVVRMRVFCVDSNVSSESTCLVHGGLNCFPIKAACRT